MVLHLAYKREMKIEKPLRTLLRHLVASRVQAGNENYTDEDIKAGALTLHLAYKREMKTANALRQRWRSTLHLAYKREMKTPNQRNYECDCGVASRVQAGNEKWSPSFASR